MMLGDSLEQLARMLDATQPGFVRCIKPNTLLQPMLLQGATCMEQLRCMGVLQLIDARKKGFSSRYPHAEFVERYKPLAPNLAGGGASAIEPFVAKLRSQYKVRGYVRACDQGWSARATCCSGGLCVCLVAEAHRSGRDSSLHARPDSHSCPPSISRT